MEPIRDMIVRHKRLDAVFSVVGFLSLFVGLATLLTLVIDLAIDGAPRLSGAFFTTYPSRFPSQAGILAAWVGTVLVMMVTALAAIPVGVAAGIYLEEYARKNWLTELIEVNITNLAGVPSIVFGLMALGLLVYKFHLGQTVLAGGLTLALMVLPIVITTTREAIRSVPGSLREAAYALGATRWRMIRDHLLPASTGGILTGVIIALSRAIGETAPLLTIGALTFIAFLPESPILLQPPFISFEWLQSPFTVLPIQMFNWISRPQAAFHENAAAAGLVLLGLTLAMNGAAVFIRHRFRKGIRW